MHNVYYMDYPAAIHFSITTVLALFSGSCLWESSIRSDKTWMQKVTKSWTTLMCICSAEGSHSQTVFLSKLSGEKTMYGFTHKAVVVIIVRHKPCEGFTYWIWSSPAVCKQHWHPHHSSYHHTQCPRHYSSKPPHDPQLVLSLQLVWCLHWDK